MHVTFLLSDRAKLPAIKVNSTPMDRIDICIPSETNDAEESILLAIFCGRLPSSRFPSSTLSSPLSARNIQKSRVKNPRGRLRHGF